jgi:(p)ppGpp synthase/HD superfamily hydrolase
MKNKNIVDSAQDYAYKKHNQPSDSQRYGSAPYSVHLEMVVAFIKKYKYLLSDDVHDDVEAAGYLHDSVEDTDTTPKSLRNLFNDRIAQIVYRVSNERGWEEKEILFKTLPKIWQCELSTFIKLCDRMANGTNSKNGTSDKSKRMYKKYKGQYPIFRYALKVEGTYDEMWVELDEIFEFIIVPKCNNEMSFTLDELYRFQSEMNYNAVDFQSEHCFKDMLDWKAKQLKV